MLLRSSSTPVLGSLLSSFSDNPNTTPHHETPTSGKNPQPLLHQNHSKLSFHQNGSLTFSPFSCNSSPISPSIKSRPGFRRAQSEGNLEGLASASCTNFDEVSDLKLPQRPSRRPTYPVLQTIPSFSFHGSICRSEDEEDSDDEENEDDKGVEGNGGLFENSAAELENVSVPIGKGEFHKDEEMKSMNGFGNINFQGIGDQVNSQMYLAKGLGVSGGGFGCNGSSGGGSDFTMKDFGRDDGPEIEEYYKRMVKENPGNPLFLRNYAQFLYHTKRDLQKAEEYYSRATLADPTDGEILSQYAKLTWEVHHDENRASSYFERAVQAAPEDSHVHAAYASFLWEADEDEDDNITALKANDTVPKIYHNRTTASASA